MGSLNYLSGFASHFETEAKPGALPQGQNSPKRHPMGLYPEQLSGSAFTMKRAENLRSWLYRIRPSVVHEPFAKYDQSLWLTEPTSKVVSPNQRRWQPLPAPEESCDFIDGVKTMVTTKGPAGCAVHHYCCDRSMGKKYFYDADGELVIIPEQGCLEILTEFGGIELEPQEIAVIPRGVKFQVNLLDEGWSRGYLGENTGRPFILPELGVLGANGLANPRDFLYPTAQYFNEEGEFTLVAKFASSFWQANLKHNPLDVVAWHGNYSPYKYDLRKFNTMGTVSYDHPDPSIYTVLTSPSEVPGQANCDFVIFPPRWLVGENTFRPPYYHRNVMNEYMGLIHGAYDAKQDGFLPGGGSLHNCMSAHGPDAKTYQKAIEQTEEPQKITDTMAFMFETSKLFYPSPFAEKTEALDKNYYQCWQSLAANFRD